MRATYTHPCRAQVAYAPISAATGVTDLAATPTCPTRPCVSHQRSTIQYQCTHLKTFLLKNLSSPCHVAWRRWSESCHNMDHSPNNLLSRTRGRGPGHRRCARRCCKPHFRRNQSGAQRSARRETPCTAQIALQNGAQIFLAGPSSMDCQHHLMQQRYLTRHPSPSQPPLAR